MTALARKLRTKKAVDLKPGDAFETRGTVVTFLGKVEVGADLFGRATIKLWCSRADTGAEGWMTFGPEGIVLGVVDSE
jgi:hypothetical protein